MRSSRSSRISVNTFARRATGLLCAFLLTTVAVAHEGDTPAGFQITTIASGLYQPVAARFAPDGRYFVIEKYGKLYAYDSVADTTPNLVKNFESQLWSYHDHGMLGLAVDPQFPTRPYVYVLYALRGKPGGRLCRVEINPATNQIVGNELVLLEAWCLIYPSHGMGDLQFGPDGSLYVTVGDAASFNNLDWGQDEPYNADGDPSGGCTCNDPFEEGGALRSQDLRTSGDPVGYNGAMIRVNPDTGAAMPNNPLIGGSTDDDRIVAYGFRNPFRFTIDQVTGGIFICDVGWNQWEEINYIANPLATPIKNFGWPCYEGADLMASYYWSGLPICDALVAEGSATAPFYTFPHVTGASVTGAAIYGGGDYPGSYIGALFVADYSQQKIMVMYPNQQGMPDPATIEDFIPHEVQPVDLQVGPDGDLFYVDLADGAINRIQYIGGHHPPTAVAAADVTSGPAPLTVQFSALQSTDPDGNPLTYGWDFNNDGDFSDSTDAEPAFTFTSSGNYPVSLKVTDCCTQFDIDTIIIAVDNGPPAGTILTPVQNYLWRVGDEIPFSGEGLDPDTGAIDPSGFTWDFILNHCVSLNPPNCHQHHMETQTGVDEGTVLAIDHEYPCSITVRLTVAEPGANGLTDVKEIDIEPEVVTLTIRTEPIGLEAGIFALLDPTPFDKQAVVNGSTTLVAPAAQVVVDTKYTFASWSDSGAAAHNITIPATDTTYTATYTANQRPVLAAIGNKTVNEGELLEFTVSATDPDGTTPVLSLNTLPSGASFVTHGNGTATFSWTPTYAQAGNYTNLNFKAADSADANWFHTRSISITVNEGNQPPVMATVGNKSVDENAQLQFTVTATDPEDTALTMTASNKPIGSSFVDNGDGSGTFTWTPTYVQAGTYTNVSFTATDAGSPAKQDSRSINITVNNVNRAPVVSAIGNQSVSENAILQVNVSASDPDGTVPLLAATGMPQGATFTDNHNGTGVFTWAADFNDAGVYPGITIIATDAEQSGLTGQRDFTVTVNNSNRKPSIDPVANVSADEGDTISFGVTASDPDQDSLTLSAENLPNGATLTDNGNGTATFNWEVDRKSADNSPYAITFIATDGDKSDSTNCTITIADVNVPVLLETIGGKDAVEGQPMSFAVIAVDPDATPTVTASGLPRGAQFVENISGVLVFYWIPDYHASEFSPAQVTFTASDGATQQSETVEIAVADAPAPGEIVVSKPAAGSSSARKGKVKTKIKWSSNGETGDKVVVELWRNGAFIEMIKGSTNNDGGINWDIPNKMPLGDGYSVRVYSKSNPLIYGASGAFSIIGGK
ncbi:MAG: PQQ-dependent sugar dehydrogenase [Candidatus Hydrogenedentes bacterium]|nr:PQQ-dependent sugar dehydrogenase [Candidatus Hydrogenedentota bacterium]